MFQLLGILLVLVFPGLAIWWFLTKKPHPFAMLSFFTVMVAVGVVFFFQERISEIDIPHFAKLKAAAAQAVVDAQQVAEIRKRIEAQGATIDLVAKSASEVQKRSEALTGQVESDAKQVGEIKGAVEQQSSTIKAVAEQAGMAEMRSKELAAKNDKAAGKIKAAEISLESLRTEVEAARKLSADLINKNDDATKRVQKIDETLEHASSTISQLEAASEFMSTSLAATANDRSAYDQLERWSKDQKYPLAARAKDTWLTILDSHSTFFGVQFPTLQWKPEIEPQKLSLADLVENYHAFPQEFFTRGSMVQYIATREDITKVDRMDFLISVLKEDKDLRVVEAAGRSFAHLADLRIKALAIDYFLDWWKDHRQSFVSPPQPAPAIPMTPAPNPSPPMMVPSK